MNHQALMLTMGGSGGYGKSLNIHTPIDHLSKHNTYTFSMIGLDNEPSYMNLRLNLDNKDTRQFSKREISIIKFIADGLNNNEIADKLFISALTVKKHRTNIFAKCDCKNAAELVKLSMFKGLI